MLTYIINRNYEIQYYDREFEEFYPHIKIGNLCHKTFCDKDEPCYGCPQEKSEERSWSLYNEFMNNWVHVQFCPMKWNKDEELFLLRTDLIRNDNFMKNDSAVIYNRPSLSLIKKDFLDELMPREVFMIEVDRFLHENTTESWCLISVDIKNFKLLNEWYGQKTGDEILQEIMSYFHDLQLKTNCIAGYFGGDDFYVVFPNNSEMIEQMWDDITNLIIQPHVENVFLPVFGVYLMNDNEIPVNSMCNMAAIAANAAKEDYQKKIVWFDNELFSAMEKSQLLLADVRRAFSNNEFHFYLQPKCCMNTDRIVSFEALARWLHPKYGIISPADYIPFLEKTGLITALDLFIWEAVCKQLAEWKEQNIQIVPVSINVSAVDIFALNFPDTLKQLLDKYKLDTQYIIVEITESAYIKNFDKMIETVDLLHKYGFKVAMDDFGSGYSSLNMLKDINVDIVKIDMNFLQTNHSNREKGLNILESIIRLINVLSIGIIAEGVETKAQVDGLLNMGCRYGQGYYFYHPMPVKDAESLLKDTASVYIGSWQNNRFDQITISNLINKSVFKQKFLGEIFGPTAICEVSRDGFQIIHMNEEALELLNLSKKEIVEQQANILGRFQNEHNVKALHYFEQAYINKEEFYAFTVKGNDKDFNPLWLRLKIYFLQERDDRKMYCVQLQNVTPKWLISSSNDESILIQAARALEEVETKEEQASVEQVLLECIHILASGDYEGAFQQFLKWLGKYYKANRAYIFEFNITAQTTSNTYEWCAPGVTSEIALLQNIPLDVVGDWIAEFERVGEFYINALNADVDNTSPAYRILKEQNIDSLITAPLIEDGHIMGFIGVDDPNANEHDLTVLRVATNFISECNFVTGLKYSSYTDVLTGLNNRNKYIKVLDELERLNLDSLGVIFTDVNGLKEMNDKYGHQCGDDMLIQYSSLLKEAVDAEHLYRIGGDEYVILSVNISEDKFLEKTASLRALIGNKASVGSAWTQRPIDIESLIKQADRSMYDEKRSYYSIKAGQSDH